MSVIVNTRYPKLCHAKPGQLVEPINPKTGTPSGRRYMVAVMPSDRRKGGGRPARPGMSHGLYDEERNLFLVDIGTGEIIEIPHLSSRASLDEAASEFFDKAFVEQLVGTTSTPVSVTVSIRAGEDDGDREEVLTPFTVNLSNEDEVITLLKSLAKPGSKLLEVATAADLEEQAAFRAWQEAVGRGETRLSFEQFSGHPANRP